MNDNNKKTVYGGGRRKCSKCGVTIFGSKIHRCKIDNPIKEEAKEQNVEDIQKLFLPYDLALLIKEKGFDKFTLKFIDKDNILYDEYDINIESPDKYHLFIPCPTYQQIIDWFEFEHNKILEENLYYSYNQQKWCISNDHPDNDNTILCTFFESKYKALDELIKQYLKFI